MADEELSLNEDQLLDNFDDANGDGDLLISEVSVFIKWFLVGFTDFHVFCVICCSFAGTR